MMDPQQQQQQNSPAVTTMLAALDAVISDAVKQVVSQMQMQHVIWHKDEKSEPGNDCHTCVLVGIAQEQQSPIVMPDAPVNGAAQEVLTDG